MQQQSSRPEWPHCVGRIQIVYSRLEAIALWGSFASLFDLSRAMQVRLSCRPILAIGHAIDHPACTKAHEGWSFAGHTPALHGPSADVIPPRNFLFREVQRIHTPTLLQRRKMETGRAFATAPPTRWWKLWRTRRWPFIQLRAHLLRRVSTVRRAAHQPNDRTERDASITHRLLETSGHSYAR